MAPNDPDQTRFERFAHRVSEATGHPTAFALAMLVIVVWAATGPIFHFDSTWQLVINTGTTIVTFLMVFLIQCMPAARPGHAAERSSQHRAMPCRLRRGTRNRDHVAGE